MVISKTHIQMNSGSLNNLGSPMILAVLKLNTVTALNNREIKSKTFYTSLFNEIFVTNEGPYFEQNRIFLGLGYQFNSTLNVLVGYINRFDQSVAHVPQWKNFWQTNLIFSFAEFKSGRALRPSTM